MTTIPDAYHRREEEAGGLAKADPEAIARRVAEELRIPIEDVRAVMLDAWTQQGAG